MLVAVRTGTQPGRVGRGLALPHPFPGGRAPAPLCRLGPAASLCVCVGGPRSPCAVSSPAVLAAPGAPLSLAPSELTALSLPFATVLTRVPVHQATHQSPGHCLQPCPSRCRPHACELAAAARSPLPAGCTWSPDEATPTPTPPCPPCFASLAPADLLLRCPAGPLPPQRRCCLVPRRLPCAHGAGGGGLVPGATSSLAPFVAPFVAVFSACHLWFVLSVRLGPFLSCFLNLL